MQDYYYKFQIMDKGTAHEKDIVISLIPSIKILEFYKRDADGFIPIMNLDIYIDKNGNRAPISSEKVVVQVTISKNFIEKTATTRNIFGRERPVEIRGPIKLQMFDYDKNTNTGRWIPIEKGQKGIVSAGDTENKDGFTFIINDWPADDRMIGRG